MHIHDLQRGDGQHSCFSGARLSLSDHVSARGHGHYGALLDGSWLLKAELKNATQQILLQAHALKGRYNINVGRGIEVRFVGFGLATSCCCHWGYRKHEVAEKKVV